MKRIFLLIIIVAVGYVVLVHKQKVREEKQQHSLENGTVYAVQYIEEKYGFTPLVKKSEIDSRSGMFNRQYNGKIIAEMCYNDRIFLVWINEDGTGGCDSYQHEEIQEALLEELKKSTPGIIAVELKSLNDIYSIDYTGFTDCLVSKKFTGDNLSEVLDGLYGNYTAYMIGSYLSGQKFESPIKQFYGTYISYRSQALWDEKPFVNNSIIYSDPETFNKYVISWCDTRNNAKNRRKPTFSRKSDINVQRIFPGSS